MSERTLTENEQLAKLRSLIGELLSGNEFYRERLEQAGLDSELESLEVYREKMPFTSKMDLVWDREEFAPYGSNLVLSFLPK